MLCPIPRYSLGCNGFGNISETERNVTFVTRQEQMGEAGNSPGDFSVLFLYLPVGLSVREMRTVSGLLTVPCSRYRGSVELMSLL